MDNVHKLFLSIHTVFFFAVSSAMASGLSKPVIIGQKAIGMGGAFVATADDATAIYHNPAGMTQMKGHNFYVGMDSLLTSENYTPTGGTKETAKKEFIPVPTFGYVTTIAEPVSFGLGVFFPHGNGGKFSSVSANPANPNEGRIFSLEIVPSFAWQIFEQLSLGVGVRAVRVAQELKTQAVAVPVGAGTVVDTLDDLNVKGWGVGAQFGLLYRPKEWISFGANYRSKVTVNLEGDATFATFGATDASFDQVLPTLFTIGTSVKPIDNLTVGLQYDFERNSEIEPLVVNLTTLNVSAPFGVKWDDSHTIHLGADYQLLENAAVRVGYAKDLNESVPDTQNNRVLGDVAAHEVSVGGAYTWRRYTFGLAWNARFGDRQWPNNGTNVAPGKLDAIVQSISFGVSTSL